MRGTFVKTLFEMMERDERIVVVTADMGFGTFEELRERFPDRFINTGVSEANAAGISAGLAMSGYFVYFYAQAAFVTLRCFEQVRLDIASNNVNVKIVGTSSGFTLCQYGVSHFALDDVAAMRSLPNMTILCPGDLYEAEAVTKLSKEIAGPVYIRIGRSNDGPDVRIHGAMPSVAVGVPIALRRSEGPVIVSTGSALFMAQRACEELEKRDVHASLFSLPTVKPLDAEQVLGMFNGTHTVYVLEEHSIIGGLGTALSELVAGAGLPLRVVRLGTGDWFVHETGSREYLLGLHGLSPKQIADRIEGDRTGAGRRPSNA
jgi:transketolase